MKFDIHFLKANFILVILICLATFLRTYATDSHGIFFPDAAKDLLTAQQAWENKQIPLLGIPSSRPWLHQGPIALWIEILVIAVFGTSTLAQSITFALLAIAAVIALYELVTIHLNKQAAYFAVALITAMPLAVAHSRVPYHTTPIPLAMVGFLWALVALWEKFTPRRFFLSILAWVVLFQLELSNAPLFVLILYVLIRRRHKINPTILGGGLGILALGFLPQLLATLRGQSNQVVEFSKWAVQQAAETAMGGTVSSTVFTKTLESFWLYGGRLFGVDSIIQTVLGLLTLTATLVYVVYVSFKKRLPPLIEITALSFIVLTAAYCVAGPPSEAYFPPYFILIPILMGYSFAALPAKLKSITTGAVFVLLVVNTFFILRSNFFVMNNTPFQYDSTGEHRKIAQLIALRAGGQSYRLTSWSMADFPHALDHIRWLALEIGAAQPGETGRLYYVEGNDQDAPPQTILLKKFETKSVYWSPQPLFNTEPQ